MTRTLLIIGSCGIFAIVCALTSGTTDREQERTRETSYHSLSYVEADFSLTSNYPIVGILDHQVFNLDVEGKYPEAKDHAKHDNRIINGILNERSPERFSHSKRSG